MNDEFNNLHLIVKRDFVLNHGEYISEINYYGFLVLLYIVNGYYIEMYYNIHSTEIDDVKIMDPTEARLALYAKNVDISEIG